MSDTPLEKLAGRFIVVLSIPAAMAFIIAYNLIKASGETANDWKELWPMICADWK